MGLWQVERELIRQLLRGEEQITNVESCDTATFLYIIIGLIIVCCTFVIIIMSIGS